MTAQGGLSDNGTPDQTHGLKTTNSIGSGVVKLIGMTLKRDLSASFSEVGGGGGGGRVVKEKLVWVRV